MDKNNKNELISTIVKIFGKLELHFNNKKDDINVTSYAASKDYPCDLKLTADMNMDGFITCSVVFDQELENNDDLNKQLDHFNKKEIITGHASINDDKKLILTWLDEEMETIENYIDFMGNVLEEIAESRCAKLVNKMLK